MNQIKDNRSAIPTRIALAAIGAIFVDACMNAGFTLNVIVPPFIYIALSIGSDSTTIYSDIDEGGIAVL